MAAHALPFARMPVDEAGRAPRGWRTRAPARRHGGEAGRRADRASVQRTAGEGKRLDLHACQGIRITAVGSGLRVPPLGFPFVRGARGCRASGRWGR
ncbi:hypothetical protein DA2_3246 [Desulfovibrio sp. A2]|nr:hypothetical protein DA2_3246 [Desulfovibrio sp. A2]